VNAVLDRFVGGADEATMPEAVSTLQSTLNRADPDLAPLKVDGVFGDKTRARLRGLVAQRGARPILDAAALEELALF
jgi:hypothetical protein